MTRQQHRALMFIIGYIADSGGVSPSYDEIVDGLGLRHSKSAAHRLVSVLDETGFIRRRPGRARSIEVLRGPPNLAVIDLNDPRLSREEIRTVERIQGRRVVDHIVGRVGRRA